jgi:signal transduction histidine kinase
VSERPGALRVPEELLLDPLPGLAALVAEVAHEIHNPISYVLGNLRALRDRVGPLSELIEAHRAGHADEVGKAESRLSEAGGVDGLEELVSDALEGASRIRALVRDLLTVSRSGGRTRVPLDPNEVIAATVRLVSRPLRERADLLQDLRSTRYVEGDAARLGQVVLNLLTNALDACDPGPAERHTIRIRTEDTESGVCIQVQDSGAGVDPELGDRIFDPFSTTKGSREGTGLGLYLSRRIVEEHGGTIGYRGAENDGTVFFVELPESGTSVSETSGES